MRIGILTLPLHTNYGGILQAYALQTVLERMGHEVVVLQKVYHTERPLWKIPLHITKVAVKKFLGIHENNVNRIISQNTITFRKKYIKEREFFSFSELHRDDYDAIVVGSDQIWRELYFKLSFGRDCNMNNAFLSFTKGWKVKRVAYAASFGKDNIEEYSADEITDCREYIKQFDSISVRECGGVEICKKKFGVEAQWVIDPTMILSSNDYKALFYDLQDSNNKTLMCYFLDGSNDIEKLAKKIAVEKKLRIMRANGKVDDSSAPIEERIQPPVEDWLKNFSDSSYVVTDSFHACVFSILFHRQFTVIANKERGYARILSLLKMFGLESRIIFSLPDYKSLPDIDYSQIDKILNIQREKAIRFLGDALKE